MKKRFVALLVMLACLLLSGYVFPESAKPAPTAEPASPYEVRRSAVNTWEDIVGNPWVQVIVEVENTGTVPLYLNSTGCDLETDDGQLFAVLSSGLSGRPQVLLPGERGVFSTETTLDAAPEGELAAVPYLDIKEATVPAVRLTVTDVSVGQDKYGRMKVMGRVENTEADALKPYVSILLYDKDENCLGCVTAHFTDNVPAGERRGFEATNIMLPKSVTPELVERTEVFAYPFQYQR